MANIESKFNDDFAHWEIRLPPDAVAQRKRGKIVKAGWAIWYLFGVDEKGEYLDYYALHRMTDDRHVRIHADGRCEDLPTLHISRSCSKDPEEDARLEAEYFAENQKIAKMLEEKGFGFSGDEPGGVQINQYLLLNKVMTDPQLLSVLRETGWSSIPSSPGVYWWYFPRNALDSLRISKLSDVTKLRLRTTPDGKVCLYHGMANNLAERVEWHAAQKLTLKCLQSGFLSTFRFTLLALNDFDYLQGVEQIDRFFDSLSVSWQVAATHREAEEMERAELQGEYQYPLNIQGNHWPELVEFVRYLKSRRSAYKRRFVQAATTQPHIAPEIVMRPEGRTVYLVSCVSQKRDQACAACELYVSDLFRKARRFAEASGRPWFILSAEHGLVRPAQVIAPYERTLNTMRVADRRAWSERVAAQLVQAIPELSRVVFLAGKRYREFLAPYLASRGVEIIVPMEGLRIGEQLNWLDKHTSVDEA